MMTPTTTPTTMEVVLLLLSPPPFWALLLALLPPDKAAVPAFPPWEVQLATVPVQVLSLWHVRRAEAPVRMYPELQVCVHVVPVRIGVGQPTIAPLGGEGGLAQVIGVQEGLALQAAELALLEAAEQVRVGVEVLSLYPG